MLLHGGFGSAISRPECFCWALRLGRLLHCLLARFCLQIQDSTAWLFCVYPDTASPGQERKPRIRTKPGVISTQQGPALCVQTLAAHASRSGVLWPCTATWPNHN